MRLCFYFVLKCWTEVPNHTTKTPLQCQFWPCAVHHNWQCSGVPLILFCFKFLISSIHLWCLLMSLKIVPWRDMCARTCTVYTRVHMYAPGWEGQGTTVLPELQAIWFTASVTVTEAFTALPLAPPGSLSSRVVLQEELPGCSVVGKWEGVGLLARNSGRCCEYMAWRNHNKPPIKSEE